MEPYASSAQARHACMSVALLGLPRRCWRCRRPTIALVGLRPAGAADAGELVTCEEEPVLAVVAGVLPEQARQAAGVGVVKPRYSRTAGRWYLSNGCVWCDALLGEYFLYTEQLPMAMAERGLAGLVEIAVADLTAEQVQVVLEYGTTWTGLLVAGDEGDWSDA